MTPITITLLIAVVIVLLIGIAYTNNVLEANKVQKARTKIELTDRLRRCRDISDVFPGQFMHHKLKHLLSRIELNLNERLAMLNKSSGEYKERIAELQKLLAMGESIPTLNQPVPIHTDAKAKEVQFLLESLHGQVSRAVQDNVVSAAEGKLWLKEIRHILVLLHIELFNNMGQQALQKAQPGQARLAFERGVQFLRKQPDHALYDKHLKQLERQLERSNAQVLESGKPAEGEVNELTEGLRENSDGDWKKKSVYD